MKQSEVIKLLEQLENTVLIDIRKSIHEKGQKFYNQLILDGYDTDQAIFELINAVANDTLKYSMLFTLMLTNDVEPDDIRDIIKRIK